MTHFANPFALPGKWFKGNLHTHSTTSDGQLTPDEVVDWYRSRGYHFLALTEHRISSEARSVAEDFILLSGIEMDGIDPTVGLFHVIGLGFERMPDLSFYEGSPSWLETTADMQQMIDSLRAAGAIAFLAHPYWSGEMSKDLLDMEGCFGLEVWNGACEVWDCKGLSAVHWDDLLAAGHRLWGLGADDCHWWPGRADAGLGWVWVKAEELTQGAILDALVQGHFYASSGPQIHDLRLEGDEIHVRCSPVTAIDFVGNGPFCRRVVAEPGETLTEASYNLGERFPGSEKLLRYMRVACQDTQCRWAWSNPIFFGDTDR
jgi:predicted metal-dependent phosphoesterase TrpH